MTEYYERKDRAITWLENQLKGILSSEDEEIEESKLIEEGSRMFKLGELTIKKRLMLMEENGRVKRSGGFVTPVKSAFKNKKVLK